MRNLICLLLLLVVSIVNGQKKPRYEETLPVILALPPSGAISQLKTYLPGDPENPSIYLQMAVIYEKRYLEGDALKDYEYKHGNARLALGSYSKTLQLIDDKTVKRSQEEYFNFGTYDEKGRLYVNYDSLMARIARSQADLQKFVDFAPAIYESFTQSFSHYDRAHKVFTGIVGEYPTFKDFYLLFNPETDAKLEEIKSNYLQFDEAFKTYKLALANYNTGYNQTLTVKEIHTYRLDGLESQINFLKDDLHVWNYAKWVDETRESIKKEIGSLRSSIVAENQRMDARLASVKSEYGTENFEPVKASKEVLFNLRKYDLKSVVEPIFIYKEKKHDLLYQELLSASLDTSTVVESDRKLYLFGQMINKIKVADSVLNDIKRRNTSECLERYPDFLSTYYGGIGGVNTYADSEVEENRKDFDHYVDQIRTELYAKLKFDSTEDVITYKKLKIPLYERDHLEYEQLGTDLITTRVLKNFDGSMFVSGISKNTKENLVQTFLCGITSDRKIAWFNEYLIIQDSATGQKAHSRIAAMQVIPGGLALIVNGEDTLRNHSNLLMIIDEKGLTTLSRKVQVDSYPRTMNFSQRDNSILVTFKGDRFPIDIFHESDLVVASLSVLGDLKWQSITAYKGDIVSLLEVDRGFMAIGNFNLIKDRDGRMQRGGKSNEETNVFVQKVGLQGEPVGLHLVRSTSPIAVNKVYRVSDDCINLFGAKSIHFTSPALQTNPENSFHIIINKDLEILSNSLQ